MSCSVRGWRNLRTENWWKGSIFIILFWIEKEKLGQYFIFFFSEIQRNRKKETWTLPISFCLGMAKIQKKIKTSRKKWQFYVCMYVLYIYIFIFTYADAYIYIYIYMYYHFIIYQYLYVYIYEYMHIYICMFFAFWVLCSWMAEIRKVTSNWPVFSTFLVYRRTQIIKTKNEKHDPSHQLLW